MTNETIVITRAIGDEAELKEALQESGYHVIHEPLTEIFLRHTARAELNNALLSDPDAVLVTSQHGVQALAMLTELRDVFLLCVGEKTAEIANNLGFSHVCMTGDNVDAMIDYISGGYDEDSRLLYVSGEHISADLGEILAIHGMQIDRVVVYEAIAAQSLSDIMIEQIKRGQIDGITFFSPRSAQIFCQLAQAAGIAGEFKNITAICLSENVALAAEEIGWRTINIASEPNLSALVACVDSVYKAV